MLVRVRIEVQEESAEACVEALMKYEHALQQQEIRRYRDLWPVTLEQKEMPALVVEGREERLPPIAGASEREYPTPDQPWSDGAHQRSFFEYQLGREITEEVIEYDKSIPGYRARRVVSFTRIDTRCELAKNESFVRIGVAVIDMNPGSSSTGTI